MLCFTIDILFAIHGLSLFLSVALWFTTIRWGSLESFVYMRRAPSFGRMWCGTIAKCLDDSFFSLDEFFLFHFTFQTLSSTMVIVFLLLFVFLASFRVFSLPLAYPFVLLHCRFMLSVMAENHFLHEAWNGGIQIKWFISVEKLSQRNTPTRWLFLFLQKHELAPKRILYIIGMASIQSAMWKWAKLFATFSIIL